MTRLQICTKASHARTRKFAKTFERRFWSRVDFLAPGGCWNWLGSTKPNGYGEVRKLGKMRTTHRVVFEMLKGPIPKGKCVCHHCDNKRCVKIEHLFLGTQKDNIYDCITKGRRRYHRGPLPKMQGEKNPLAKLTDTLVRAIRSKDLSRLGAKAKLARRLGVSGPLISYVLSRKIWTHVS